MAVQLISLASEADRLVTGRGFGNPGQSHVSRPWVFAENGARVLIVAKDCATTGETAAKLSGGGGIAVCVNAGIVPDHRLGDMADEDMNQVVDIKLKHCTLTAHACRSATVVPRPQVGNFHPGRPRAGHCGAQQRDSPEFPVPDAV